MANRLNRSLILAFFLMSALVFAGTKSAARTALESGDYSKTISLLSRVSMKSAEENYLLGKAYLELGDRMNAVKAWNETVQINKSLPKKEKWTFLFTPSKKLSGTEKKKLYSQFQTEFKTLSAAAVRSLKNESKEMKSEAAHKKIDANTLTKKANAKTEAIKSKQKVADRKAKSNRSTRASVKGEGTSISFLTLLMIVVGIALVVMIVIYFARKGGDDDDDFEEASFGTQHYHVSHNNSRFDSGAFWFEGFYFHSQMDFHRRYGYYYTNAMYMDNYDQYGRGQGRDTALDNEILNDIDQREDMRNESADLEGEAAHLEQDAAENQDLINELEDSSASMDEEPEFGDDTEEPEEEETPDFEDDVEEEPEPEEEPEEEPSFEDDEEENN